jgi:UDP-N-acetylglucosamine--N-acetylmuramyl-(pentapeptide) pyrophosphoryl-undecaprenol N-acetylglucosamine transferase
MPGLTNRWLGQWADSIALSFPDSRPHFPEPKTWISGLPIRAEIGTADSAEARRRLGLEAALPTFLIFGGSQGALRLNEHIVSVFQALAKENLRFQILHITGPRSYATIREAYEKISVRAIVLPYCHAMADAYAAADWVICRAGASTVAELIAAQRPATLVPYPFASNNHQAFNAAVLQKAGVADVIVEKDFDREALARRFREWIQGSTPRFPYRERFGALKRAVPMAGAAGRLADYLTGRGQ